MYYTVARKKYTQQRSPLIFKIELQKKFYICDEY